MMKLQLTLLALVSAASCSPRPLLSTRPLFNATGVNLRASTRDVNQHLSCYDNRGCQGIQVEFDRYPVPNLGLSPYYFDNRIVSCIYNGIYLLHDDYNYNDNNLNAGVFAEAWGENRCVEMNDFSYKASSVRLAGAPNGYKYSTLNFYEGEYYAGEEQYFYQDAPYVDTRISRSMIITGCDAWTVYEGSNYSGQRRCFYPSDTINCYPSFFRDQSMMQGFGGYIASARRGCFSKDIVRGEAMSRSSQPGQYFLPKER